MTDEIWADRLAAALGDAYVDWLRPTGRPSGTEGQVRWYAGVPGFAPFNLVVATGRTVDVADLDRAEQALLALEPQHRISARASVESVVGPWVLERGYAYAGSAPALVLEGDAFDACLAAPLGPPRTQRALPSDTVAFTDAAAGIFGLPAERIRVLCPPSLAEDPRASLRFALVDDVVVGTAQGWTEDGAIGVFNVAVVPELRGKGLGSELTAAVVADGAAAGGTWAYLQSSDEGLHVYERLGFRTVDHWCTWMPEGTDEPW